MQILLAQKQWLVLASAAMLIWPRAQQHDRLPRAARSYYVSAAGNDGNDGSPGAPLRTIGKANTLRLQPGDEILFRAGDRFPGKLRIDSTRSGSPDNPVVVGSYGTGQAILDAGDGAAVTIFHASHIALFRLTLTGSGRKNGNTASGIVVDGSESVAVRNCEASGFQKSGLRIYRSKNVSAEFVYAHDNGFAGISVEGPDSLRSNTDIRLLHCTTNNNPGDPTNLDNHSGNGIVVSSCRRVLIDHCAATNNGWDMPRTGNGPVGIWAFEADSVTIQHCLAYRNKTSAGGGDGGGFDLDGGVTHSVVQYCLSYENQGAGYCLFQYLYASSAWHDNVFRFNISVNDGLVSDARAGLYLWNSSGDPGQFYRGLVYNNTIYNDKNPAISYSELSERKDFAFYNNIFVGADSLIKGARGNRDEFIGNDWWSITAKFNAEGRRDFSDWSRQTGLERLQGKLAGSNADPGFKRRANPAVTETDSLKFFTDYRLPERSPLRSGGIDLGRIRDIRNGGRDFCGRPVPVSGVGACF